MMRLSVLIFFGVFVLVSLESNQPLGQETGFNPVNPGRKTYIDIRDTLQDNGKEIGYDTLLDTYRALINTQHAIPHLDQLLVSLINKRNDNPRIDQMILIFAARALGSSKFPVSDAYGIFEAILLKDDRLTEWVLAFVAEAIGDYAVDMPEGNKLVDLLETKLSMVVSSSDPKKEDFGNHFLPPPKGEYIRSYMANIKSMRMRMSERRHYFALINIGYKEAEIESALRRVQSNGMSAKREFLLAPMKHLAQNPDQIAK